MPLFRKRSMEVLLQPSTATQEQPPVDWVDADSVRVRVSGHEVEIKNTKEGLEISYVTPKNKKPRGVSAEASLDGARLRILP
jgi:hypothetical protein